MEGPRLCVLVPNRDDSVDRNITKMVGVCGNEVEIYIDIDLLENIKLVLVPRSKLIEKTGTICLDRSSLVPGDIYSWVCKPGWIEGKIAHRFLRNGYQNGTPTTILGFMQTCLTLDGFILVANLGVSENGLDMYSFHPWNRG